MVEVGCLLVGEALSFQLEVKYAASLRGARNFLAVSNPQGAEYNGGRYPTDSKDNLVRLPPNDNGLGHCC